MLIELVFNVSKNLTQNEVHTHNVAAALTFINLLPSIQGKINYCSYIVLILKSALCPRSYTFRIVHNINYLIVGTCLYISYRMAFIWQGGSQLDDIVFKMQVQIQIQGRPNTHVLFKMCPSVKYMFYKCLRCACAALNHVISNEKLVGDNSHLLKRGTAVFQPKWTHHNSL